MQGLTFRVAGKDFIMDASRIRGLVPAYEVTPLEVPIPWIIGVASIRGHDFPVIDLPRKLHIARGGARGRLPCVIAVEVASSSGPRLIGFIADRVSKVVAVQPADQRKEAVRISGRAHKMLIPDSILSEEELPVDWRMSEAPVNL